ncbi:MAG: TolC family protein [Acidobacteriota bacterium]|nr:TolC family protein [Acidobacteriota bacterium]
MSSIVLLAVWLPIAAPAVAQEARAPEPITLAEVLAAGRAESPAIAAARSREQAAVAAAGVAGRWPNPALEFRSENFGADVPGGLPVDSFATVTQTLELGGKRGARRGAAQARAEMARVDAFAATRGIEGDLAARFLEAVRLRDRTGILTTQRDALAELVRVLERRVAEGFAPDADRARLAAETTTVAITAVRAETAANRAFLDLRALAALPEGATAAALVRPDPLAPPTGDPAQLAAGAAAERPDVRAAAARVETALRAVRLQNSLRVPDLTVNTGLKRTLDTNTGVFALGVGLPVFDRNQVAATLARGEVRAAELERDLVTRRAEADATAALLNARRLAEAAAGSEAQLVEPATVARTAMRSAFDLGAADILLVVDAERAFADARLLANDIRIEAVAAAIAARLALGEAPLP